MTPALAGGLNPWSTREEVQIYFLLYHRSHPRFPPGWVRCLFWAIPTLFSGITQKFSAFRSVSPSRLWVPQENVSLESKQVFDKCLVNRWDEWRNVVSFYYLLSSSLPPRHAQLPSPPFPPRISPLSSTDQSHLLTPPSSRKPSSLSHLEPHPKPGEEQTVIPYKISSDSRKISPKTCPRLDPTFLHSSLMSATHCYTGVIEIGLNGLGWPHRNFPAPEFQNRS